jgi:glycosyltransferase involved in cell wall biosynthesis
MSTYYKLTIFFCKIKYRSIEMPLPNGDIVKLPNIIFTNLNSCEKIEELHNINRNDIYIYINGSEADYLHELKMWTKKMEESCGIKLSKVRINVVEFNKKINFARLRRLQDLTMLNYYLKSSLSKNDKYGKSSPFYDRFMGHYSFYKTPEKLFNEFPLNKAKKRTTKNVNANRDKRGKINVMYCIFYSPQYEHIGYTIRTHNLLKNTHNVRDSNCTNDSDTNDSDTNDSDTNDNEPKVNIVGMCRYGYPHDKKKDYYDRVGLDEFSLDEVPYKKLLDKQCPNDNFNNGNIVSYIRKYATRLIEECRHHKIDVLHATSNWWNGMAVLLASRVLGIPCIYELRGFWDESVVASRSELYKSDMQFMKRKVEKVIFENVDQVLTINENLRDEIYNRIPILFSEDGSTVPIIPNCADGEKFVPHPKRRYMKRKKLGISDDTMLIGYIGSILSYEGIDYIVNALHKLINEDKLRVKFILAGDGNERNNIISLASKLGLDENAFEYIGKINHDEVVDYYDAFDIVCYPRRNDKVCRTTSSSKIFETMCMGKPIIVSELPAYDEIIIDRYNGLYCEPDNEVDIYEKMKELIINKDLRDTLSINTRNWVIKNREWASVGKKLRLIYFQTIFN